MFRYNICTDEWFRAPALNESGSDHVTCVIGNNTLYVCGGIDESFTTISSIERLVGADSVLDEASGNWETL